MAKEAILLILYTEHGACVAEESSNVRELLKKKREFQQLLDSSPVPDTRNNYTKLFLVRKDKLGLRGSENLGQTFVRQKITFAKLKELERETLRVVKGF